MIAYMKAEGMGNMQVHNNTLNSWSHWASSGVTMSLVTNMFTGGRGSLSDALRDSDGLLREDCHPQRSRQVSEDSLVRWGELVSSTICCITFLTISLMSTWPCSKSASVFPKPRFSQPGSAPMISPLSRVICGSTLEMLSSSDKR